MPTTYVHNKHRKGNVIPIISVSSAKLRNGATMPNTHTLKNANSAFSNKNYTYFV